MLTFDVRVVNTRRSIGQLGYQLLDFLLEGIVGSISLVVSPALLNTLQPGFLFFDFLFWLFESSSIILHVPRKALSFS
jgi:hypothetical protein